MVGEHDMYDAREKYGEQRSTVRRIIVHPKGGNLIGEAFQQLLLFSLSHSPSRTTWPCWSWRIP